MVLLVPDFLPGSVKSHLGELAKLLVAAGHFDDAIREVCKHNDKDAFVAFVNTFQERIHQLNVGEVCVLTTCPVRAGVGLFDIF
jgi:hypothetical protein